MYNNVHIESRGFGLAAELKERGRRHADKDIHHNDTSSSAKGATSSSRSYGVILNNIGLSFRGSHIFSFQYQTHKLCILRIKGRLGSLRASAFAELRHLRLGYSIDSARQNSSFFSGAVSSFKGVEHFLTD